MKRAIALTSSDTALKPHLDALQAIVAKTDEQLGFLRRKAEDIQKQSRAETGEVWKRIEEECIRLGLVDPGFKDRKKEHLEFDSKAGVLFHCDGDHKGVDLLASIFGMIP